MAANKRLEYGSPLQCAVPALGSYTFTTYPIQSGNPVLLRGLLATAADANGKPTGMAMVANETPVSPTGFFDGFCSFDLWGGFDLTVTAESAESPVVNSAVQPGDVVYANINTGTYDAGTGLFYGFTLDKNKAGIPFGTVVLGSLVGGTTGIVTVRLKEGL